MTKNNYGISTGGGNVSATSLAVGDRATITISGDMPVVVEREVRTIRALLRASDISPEKLIELLAAVETIAGEAKSQKMDRSKVASALANLEKATKIGNGMLGLGEKLAPHVTTLSSFLV